MEIIITGEWDGEPIWRYKTAEDRLIETLYEQRTTKQLTRNYQTDNSEGKQDA